MPLLFALRFHCCLIVLFVICISADAVSFNGKNYVPVKDYGKSIGMDFSWIKKNKSGKLASKWTTIEFTNHKNDILLNGIRIYLTNPIALHRGGLYLAQQDIDKTLSPIITPQHIANKRKLYRIMIDPGHGGNDPGAENNHLKINEKKYALEIAQKLEQKLEALGYDVVLTRNSDRTLSLGERSRKANTTRGVDLFLSIHFNAHGNTRVKGIETYVMTPQNQSSLAGKSSKDRYAYQGNQNDWWNTLAGYYIQRALIKKTNANDRGLKRARFSVLRETAVPAVLLELGFISNEQEGSTIKREAYRNQLTDAVVAGILQYQKTLNRIRGR